MLSFSSAENAQHAQSPKQCRANMSCIQGTVQQCLSSRIRCFHGPAILPDRLIRRSTAQVILETHTCEKCPQRRISPLECTDTKNAPASPLECALTKSLDLKSFRSHSFKKHRGAPCLSPGGVGA